MMHAFVYATVIYVHKWIRAVAIFSCAAAETLALAPSLIALGPG